MKKPMAILSSILCLVITMACNKPHLDNIASHSIQAGTVVIGFTNGINGSVEMIIDGNRVYTNRTGKSKKYHHLEVSGLEAGKHHFIITSAHEIFGPDQFELNLNNQHGEYRNVFSKNLNYILAPEISEATPTVNKDCIIKVELK